MWVRPTLAAGMSKETISQGGRGRQIDVGQRLFDDPIRKNDLKPIVRRGDRDSPRDFERSDRFVNVEPGCGSGDCLFAPDESACAESAFRMD
jgi:hypothetical protein